MLKNYVVMKYNVHTDIGTMNAFFASKRDAKKYALIQNIDDENCIYIVCRAGHVEEDMRFHLCLLFE